MTTPNSKAIRGYIFSRPINGDRVPQHIQNLIVRDYASRKSRDYLLSATEYASSDCFLMLEATIDGLGDAHGIVMYSMHMLPKSARHRERIYNQLLSAGKTLYAAVEDIQVADRDDVEYLETLLRLTAHVQRFPRDVTIA